MKALKIVGVCLWFVAHSLGTGLLGATACRMLWSWFVRPEYGSGPSAAAWFGLVSIAEVAISISQVATKKWGDYDTLRKLCVASLVTWIGMLVALCVSWTVGAICGWV